MPTDTLDIPAGFRVESQPPDEGDSDIPEGFRVEEPASIGRSTGRIIPPAGQRGEPPQIGPVFPHGTELQPAIQPGEQFDPSKVQAEITTGEALGTQLAAGGQNLAAAGAAAIKAIPTGLARAAGGLESLNQYTLPGQLTKAMGVKPFFTDERVSSIEQGVNKAIPTPQTNPELHGLVNPETAGGFAGGLAPAAVLGPEALIAYGAGEGAGLANQEIAQQRAEGHEVSPGEEHFGRLGQALVNALLYHFAGKGMNVAPAGGKVVNALASGVTSAGIGAAGQVAQNVVAGTTYDPNRTLEQGVPEAAAGAGITGAGISLFHGKPPKTPSGESGTAPPADTSPPPPAPETRVQPPAEPPPSDMPKGFRVERVGADITAPKQPPTPPTEAIAASPAATEAREGAKPVETGSVAATPEFEANHGRAVVHAIEGEGGDPDVLRMELDRLEQISKKRQITPRDVAQTQLNMAGYYDFGPLTRELAKDPSGAIQRLRAALDRNYPETGIAPEPSKAAELTFADVPEGFRVEEGQTERSPSAVPSPEPAEPQPQATVPPKSASESPAPVEEVPAPSEPQAPSEPTQPRSAVPSKSEVVSPSSPDVTVPAPAGKAEGAPLTGAGGIRQDVVDRILSKAKAAKLARAVPVDEKLTSAEQQWLAAKGVTFTTDRQNRPMVNYSQEARARDLREAVAAKRPVRSVLDQAASEQRKAEALPKTWYRGTREGQDESGGTFWSGSPDAADAFGKTEKRAFTPKNPLVYDSKQTASDALGLGHEDVMDLPLDEHAKLDQAIAADARSKGHDAVVYRNGSFDAPEMHLLNEAPPAAPANPDQIAAAMTDAGIEPGRVTEGIKKLQEGSVSNAAVEGQPPEGSAGEREGVDTGGVHAGGGEADRGEPAGENVAESPLIRQEGVFGQTVVPKDTGAQKTLAFETERKPAEPVSLPGEGVKASKEAGKPENTKELFPGGPGQSVSAAGANDPYMDPATGTPSLQILGDVIRKATPEKAELHRSMDIGAKVAESAGKAKDAFTRGYDRVKGGFVAMLNAYRAAPSKLPYERIVRRWSGADNKSAQDIRDNIVVPALRAVPNKVTRGGIGIYIEAGGDKATLEKWAKEIGANPKTKKYGPIFDAALNLTDDQKAIASATGVRNDATLAEAQKAGLLKDGVEDYLMHVWADDPSALRRIAAESNFSSLITKPSFTKQRTIPTYFDGIMKGMTPKDLDFASLTAAHERAMRQALASRATIKELHENKASDGRPLVAIAKASAKEVGGEAGVDPAFMVTPNLRPTDNIGDYRAIDHPSLRGWRWAATDAEGKPVFVQGDMLVHPEIYHHLKNNLTPSAIRQWTVEMGGKSFKPGEAYLNLQSGLKSTILSLSGFHQTTLAVHALEHRTKPGFMPKIDLKPGSLDMEAMDHGLMLAHYDAHEAFMEGNAGVGLVGKIPVVGQRYQAYVDYLFKDYLPRVKMEMFRNAFKRNTEVYGKKLNRDQILDLTADQANAAFGGVNLRVLGRNKTFQDVLRGLLLAPDFTEARARFVGQAVKPHGHEQRVALALGAAAMYTTGVILNQMLDGETHWDKPFTLVYKGREYGLRTIQGDLQHLYQHPGQFVLNRLAPIPSFVLEELFGVNGFGEPASHKEIAGDAVRGAVPIPVQAWTQRRKAPAVRRAIDTILKTVGINSRMEQTEQKPPKWVNVNAPRGNRGTSSAPKAPAKPPLPPLPK